EFRPPRSSVRAFATGESVESRTSGALTAQVTLASYDDGALADLDDRLSKALSLSRSAVAASVKALDQSPEGRELRRLKDQLAEAHKEWVNKAAATKKIEIERKAAIRSGNRKEVDRLHDEFRRARAEETASGEEITLLKQLVADAEAPFGPLTIETR